MRESSPLKLFYGYERSGPIVQGIHITCFRLLQASLSPICVHNTLYKTNRITLAYIIPYIIPTVGYVIDYLVD